MPSYEFRDDRRSKLYEKGRAGQEINTIVIHHWGADGQKWDNLTAYTLNPGRNMSVHYIAEAGRVEQQVDEADTAWHASYRDINRRSIGIECRPEATDADYETVGELIANIWSRRGKLALEPHKKYRATSCPGRYDLGRLREIAERYAEPKVSEGVSVTPGAPAGVPYTVVAGDSPWSIAERVLGGGSLYTTLMATNGLKSDAIIYPGQVLIVPGYHVPEYTVVAGDSPWSIAQRELGDGRRWTEIATLNGWSGVPVIYPGDILKMPAK